MLIVGSNKLLFFLYFNKLLLIRVLIVIFKVNVNVRLIENLWELSDGNLF